MSHFENSEVMLEYAKLMRPDLVKVAWTWRDMVSNLGTEVAGMLAGAGIAAGGAAIGGAGVAGMGAAAVATLTNPIGWIFASAGLAYAIYDAVSMSDDNVTDLINRIEAMDYEGTSEETRVTSWLTNLQQMKGALQSPPTTTDPAERAHNNGRMLVTLSGLQMYLRQMSQEWSQVAPKMEDWSLDVGQAKAALDNTLQAVNSNLANLKKQISAAKVKMLQEAERSSGVDIRGLSKQIFNVYNEITKVDGSPPVPETSEEGIMLGFINKIVQSDQQVTQEQAAKYAPQLNKMLEAFTKLLEQNTSPCPTLKQALLYTTISDGKMLRAALVFALNKNFNNNLLLDCATAIELIHTYSIVHDDLPAMDDDDVRRGKTSCHKQFNEATAILVGDSLQSLAFGRRSTKVERLVARNGTLKTTPSSRLRKTCAISCDNTAASSSSLWT